MLFLAYKPIGGDLAYPEKLILAKKIGIGLERGSELQSPLSDVVSVSSIGWLYAVISIYHNVHYCFYFKFDIILFTSGLIRCFIRISVMAAPVRKNIYRESQMIAKLSREDLEDKHLRLLQEFDQLKKDSLAQEDKYKHLFVQLNKLKTLQGKFPSEHVTHGRTANPQLQKMMENLQNKVSQLELRNEKLENKLQLSKVQSQPKRPQSRPDSRKHNLSRMEGGCAEPAQYAPPHPPRYGHSLLEQARQDNQRLEECVLSLKTEISVTHSSMQKQEQENEQACRGYEQRIERLKQELDRSHGMYEISTSRENVDILRLQRDLLDKTSQLDALKAEHWAVLQTLERVRESHAHVLEELDYSNSKLREEQKHSTELLGQVRAITLKNVNLVELQERIGDVKSENKLLKATNDELMKSAFDEERLRSHRAEVLAIQNKLDLVELAYREDLKKKSESLDRLQMERAERDKSQKELAELQKVYFKLKEEHEQMQTRLSFITGPANTDWTELEEALAYIRVKREDASRLEEAASPGEVEELRRELLEMQAAHAESVLELDKTRSLLEVEHRICRAERDKTENMRARMEDMRADYERKADESVHLLDMRAQRIRKLETQLREIAYGTRKYRLRAEENESEEEEAQGEVELQRGQNLLEVHLHELSLHSEVRERFEGAEPSLFLSYDFFEFETEMTPVTKGYRPLFDFKSQFIVNVDDFFLEYVMKQNVPLEIYQALGLEYRLVGKGHFDLKSVLHDQGGNKIRSTAVATGAGDFRDTVQFGTLEYWVRIRLPVREAFRLYQDRASALLAVGEREEQKLVLETELVNELVIRVQSCEALAPRREGTVPSPYVMYKFFEYPDHDTEIVPSSTDPSWDDVKKYPVTMDRPLDRYLKTESLEFYVFDDTDPDLKQYLGLCKVSLLPLVSSSRLEGTHPLLNSAGARVGSLKLKLNWTKSYLPAASWGLGVPLEIPPPLDVQSDSDPEREESVQTALPQVREKGEKEELDSEIEEEILRLTYTLSSPPDTLQNNSHFSVVSPLLTDTMSSLGDNSRKLATVEKQSIPSPLVSEQEDQLIDGLIAEMETDNSTESVHSLSLPPTPPNETDTFNSEHETMKSSVKASVTLDSLSTFHPSAFFTILLHSLTAVSDLSEGLVGHNLIYVDYEFLNYDIEELETPNSIPIPAMGESVLFNFQKMFDFQSSPDSENKRKMLQGMLLEGSGSVSNASSVKFTLVSDPQGGSEEQNCEELGCAYLDLMQVVSSEFNNISAELPVFRLSSPASIIANLTVHLLEIDLLKEFAHVPAQEQSL